MVLKDSYGTNDRMHTTAGSVVMGDFIATADSFRAAKLRASDAVLIGKANMDEFSMAGGGYSLRGAQIRNAYAVGHISGSSSGGPAAAVSANFALVALGVDTTLQIPAAVNGIVTIRPTFGLVGRTGIIPSSLFSDTPGPMARTVADAASILGVMTGVDPDDDATSLAQNHGYSDYTQFLKAGGLKGAHIGVRRTPSHALLKRQRDFRGCGCADARQKCGTDRL